MATANTTFEVTLLNRIDYDTTADVNFTSLGYKSGGWEDWGTIDPDRTVSIPAESSITLIINATYPDETVEEFEYFYAKLIVDAYETSTGLSDTTQGQIFDVQDPVSVTYVTRITDPVVATMNTTFEVTLLNRLKYDTTAYVNFTPQVRNYAGGDPLVEWGTADPDRTVSIPAESSITISVNATYPDDTTEHGNLYAWVRLVVDAYETSTGLSDTTYSQIFDVLYDPVEVISISPAVDTVFASNVTPINVTLINYLDYEVKTKLTIMPQKYAPGWYDWDLYEWGNTENKTYYLPPASTTTVLANAIFPNEDNTTKTARVIGTVMEWNSSTYDSATSASFDVFPGDNGMSSFVQDAYTFDIKREYNEVNINIKNIETTKVSHNLIVNVLDPPEGIPISIIDDGGPAQPITALIPFDEKDLSLGVMASNADQLTYNFTLELSDGLNVHDTAMLQLNLPSWDSYSLGVHAINNSSVEHHSPLSWDVSVPDEGVGDAEVICLISCNEIIRSASSG